MCSEPRDPEAMYLNVGFQIIMFFSGITMVFAFFFIKNWLILPLLLFGCFNTIIPFFTKKPPYEKEDPLKDFEDESKDGILNITGVKKKTFDWLTLEENGICLTKSTSKFDSSYAFSKLSGKELKQLLDFCNSEIEDYQLIAFNLKKQL